MASMLSNTRTKKKMSFVKFVFAIRLYDSVSWTLCDVIACNFFPVKAFDFDNADVVNVN